MKGIFNHGPAIVPLFHTYLTARGFSDHAILQNPERRKRLTLVVRHQDHKECKGYAPSVHAMINMRQYSGVVCFQCRRVICIGCWRRKASIDYGGHCEKKFNAADLGVENEKERFLETLVLGQCAEKSKATDPVE